MTRDDLKSLVKECLLEIIIEGTPKNVVENLKERKLTPRQQPTQQPTQKPTVSRPALDFIHPNGAQRKPLAEKSHQTSKKSPAVDNIRNIVGENHIMAEIFADTAKSGLVERIGSPGSNENANPLIDTGFDPTLFEGSENWATMAFSNVRNNSR